MAALGSFGVAATEPTYDGKPTSFWLNNVRSPNGMQETIKAFKAMGSNAVPFLIATLARKPSKLGEAVDDKLYKDDVARYVPKGVVNALPSAMRTEDRRENAAFLLGEIGPDAEAAIPALMTVLNDPTEGWRIIANTRGALLAMGEKLAGQVPQFIAYLESDDSRTRQLGAVLLASTGPKARSAVPALLRLAESQDYWASLDVARALWNIAQQTNVAVRVYTNCLQSTNSTHRQLALIYLRQMGPAAKEAAPRVELMLRDPDSVVRTEAEKTLNAIDANLLRRAKETINREMPAQVAKLVRALESKDFTERFRALETIWVLGPDAKPAVPALIEVLTGPAPQLPGSFARVGLMNSRRNAAEALAEIGSEARAAVPALISAFTEHRGNNASYCRALGCIGPDAKEAVGALEAALTDENRGFRLAAATAMTKIAPEQCSNAVVVLRSLQHDPALAAVWAVDKSGVATQTSQKDYQNPASRFFRLAASVPLWRLGLEKEPPVSAIVEALKRHLDSNEIYYVQLLGDIGPDAKASLATLKTFLAPDTFIKLRQAAAIAIRKIDPDEAAKLGLPGTLLLP